MKISAIILSAGNSTRFKSSTPKVFQNLCGRPLIDFNVDLIRQNKKINDFNIITNKKLEKYFAKNGFQNTFIQNPVNGTGGAIQQYINKGPLKSDYYLICLGDTPVINKKIIDDFINQTIRKKLDINVLGQQLSSPKGYGRLVVSKNNLIKIVEEKDCSAEEKNISLINTGFFLLSKKAILLSKNIKKNINKKEYYLTDLVEIGLDKKLKVSFTVNKYEKVLGVNTIEELQSLEQEIQSNIKIQLTKKGVRFENPATTFISMNSKIDKDVYIESNVVIKNNVFINKGTLIKAFTYLEDCEIGKECSIGPFARIRPGTLIDNNVKIGNFVEIKKSHLKSGVKAGHLSYIGDSNVGKNSNIGAGTITCNYDGRKKNRCIIGDNCFIGSNSSIVAPVKILNKAYIGAGSVITKDVPANTLSLTRIKQKFIKK